jgi:hypothetical protein
MRGKHKRSASRHWNGQKKFFWTSPQMHRKQKHNCQMGLHQTKIFGHTHNCSEITFRRGSEYVRKSKNSIAKKKVKHVFPQK